ncbi:MAG: SDR family oxidoreductase, partial [Proteobacteria bacterium]
LKNGDRVMATGRDLLKRRELLSDLRKQYPQTLSEYSLDVTVAAEREQLVRNLGALDILVNNAGYGLTGALEDLSEDQIRHQMEVNFFGTVLLTQACLPRLRESKGRIFNLSSVLGFMGLPLTSLYCASKFAIEGFSESLSLELDQHGVQVCLIQPGAFRTNFAKGLLWGARSLESRSPYRAQSEKYEQLQKRVMSESQTSDPQEVATTIVQLSLKKKMPLRVRCGKDAQASHLAKSLIPAGLFQIASQRVFRKAFSKDPQK